MDFTIVITNYNRAQFLDRAVRSCLSQYLIGRKTQVIVVDDCSTDDSLGVLEDFGSRIEVVSFDKNAGVAAASNAGLDRASSPYWMRVDADDFLSAEACAQMGAILDNNPEIGFVYGDHIRVDLRGKKQEHVRLNSEDMLFAHGAGVLFRTELLRTIGGYDAELRNAEDYDLLLRLKKSGVRGYYLPVPLYRYYIHGDNLTLAPERKIFWEKVNEKHNI